VEGESPLGELAGEGDPRAEIDFHLEARARELEAQGMDPDRARLEARRAFGDVERVAREVERIDRRRRREETMRTMVDALVRDARYALRGLVRNPGLAVVTILTLGLGIGAVTAVFSVVNASLIRALPLEEGEGIVFLQGAYDAPDGPAIRGASVPEARDWKARARSFTEVAAGDGTAVTLTGDGVAERVPAEQVGEGYFRLMRVEPLLGRTFTEEEIRVPGAHYAVILGHDLWTRRFAADPEVLGRTVDLGGEPWTVVGVMPPDFAGATLNADLWIPLASVGEGTMEARGSRFLAVVARLAPGVEVAQAQAEMDRIAAELEAEHPRAHEDRIALVTPARDVYLGSTRTLVLICLGAAGLLLLITVANVVNLLLVKASARRAEVSMRQAMGAGRGRLLSQFAVEGGVLAVLGAALGLALGTWGAGALAAAMPEALLPSWVRVEPDLTVFLGVTLLLAAVGIAAGLVPGLASARTDIARSLREGGRGAEGGGSRVRSAIVVGEVALALLLLVGAALMTRSFRAQLAVDPGYDHRELYGFQLSFPAERYAGEELRPALDDLERRLEARGEVAAATVMSDIPLRSGYSAAYLWRADATADDDRIRFYLHRVGPDWFETMGTPIRAGRAIEAADAESEAQVAVISQALADRFYPGEDPVGRTLFLGTRDDGGHVIVGVAGDVRYRDLTTDIRGGADDPDVYIPWERYPSRSVGVVLRPRGTEPHRLDAVSREVVSDTDPLMPLTGAGPLADDLRTATAQARFGSLLLSTFAGLALLLAVVGLYGVLSFTVRKRRRAIAVRMALGADGRRVQRMIVWDGVRLVGAGLAVGLVAALLSTRALESFLFGVRPLDLPTYAATALLMALVAALAAWIPALRATRTEPQAVLRQE
jgi:predicted permease